MLATGRSPQGIRSVTVTAPLATHADILSTALFVMEPAEALAYIDARKEYACLLIDERGQLFPSQRFRMNT